MRATKSAGLDTAQKKSRGKYGWVHNFDFRQVNYVKHLEMAFFHLPYRFESWQTTTNDKQKNTKRLEMLTQGAIPRSI